MEFKICTWCTYATQIRGKPVPKFNALIEQFYARHKKNWREVGIMSKKLLMLLDIINYCTHYLHS